MLLCWMHGEGMRIHFVKKSYPRSVVVQRPVRCQITGQACCWLRLGFTSMDSTVLTNLNANLFGDILCIPFSVNVLPHLHLSDGCSAKWRGRNELSISNPTEDKKALSASVVCHPSLTDHFQIIWYRPWGLLGTLVYSILGSSGDFWEFLAAS